MEEENRLGTLDSWVILVSEVVLGELEGQGGFPDACLEWIPKRMGEGVIGMLTTDTDDNDFVLSQELCLETVSGMGSAEE